MLSQKKWQKRGALVEEAIGRNEKGQKINVVSFDWLDDSLQAKSKRAERVYSWLKKENATAKTKGSDDPRSTAGLMSQVFTESTEGFLTDAHRKKIAKRQQLEADEKREEEKKQVEDFAKQREQMNIVELANMFKRGVKKDRNELLTDSYRVYVDGMGFTYDAVLEPVPQMENSDHRYTVRVSRVFTEL